MANGMKLWLGVLAGACALVAMWALPPSTLSYRSRVPLAEEARVDEIAAEVQHAHGVLMTTRWSDSLSALVVESAVDGLALAHPPSDLVTQEGVDEWRALVAARLDSYETRDPLMTVGLVLQTDRHGALEGVLLPRFGQRPQTYVGVLDGSPYCYVVEPERYPATNGALRYTRTLDGCAWHAKYGMPGPAVAEWLEAGAFDFAAEGRVADVDAVLGPASPDWIPFGMLRPSSEPLVVAACIAGNTVACERAITDPTILAVRRIDPRLAAESPMSHMAAGRFTPFQTRSLFLFSEWEAEYGAEAFARFWHSDQAVPAAFQAAFGVGLGAWVRDWAAAEIGSFRAGPAPHLSSILWSVLALIGLGAFASVKQVRRRVA